jgi:hypothetical protein
VLYFSAAAAFADLPIEHPGVVELKPDNGHRLYIADKTPPAHAVDSKIRVIDGDDFSVLGQLTNGSFGSFSISADRKTLFDATSFFSRGDHGTRTDVLEYYDTTSLMPRGETILLSKRAMSNQYPVFLVESAAGEVPAWCRTPHRPLRFPSSIWRPRLCCPKYRPPAASASMPPRKRPAASPRCAAMARR